jgi:mRNA-degrading endonuclease RelE of RelBE toxin-antitoxin system
MAQVLLTPDAQRQLDRLPAVIYLRMLAFERLQEWPKVSGAKPLRGTLAGHFRVRTGDYRVQFRIAGNEVIVEKLGHRDGFYED